MHIEVVHVPETGVRKDISLTNFRRIGVVDRRDGTVEPLVGKGKPGDPDVADRIPMSASEAALLAALLGAPQLVARPQDDSHDVRAVAHVPIHRGSTYDGQRLGRTRMRARTKASIVAVIRAERVIPSPSPDLVFTTGDVLVIVGTADGLTAATRILTHG